MTGIRTNDLRLRVRRRRVTPTLSPRRSIQSCPRRRDIVRRSLAIFCLAALVWSASDGAAAQAVRASVLGTVTDRTGAVLPGATVTVTNPDTAVVQSTVADSQGRYTVTSLLPAAYKVEASLSGFQTVVRDSIRLVVGVQAVVDFTLGPSAVQETITVTAAAPVVDTVSAALGT